MIELSLNLFFSNIYYRLVEGEVDAALNPKSYEGAVGFVG